MTGETANEQAQERILVLGSAPHTRLVTAYTWDTVPSDFNIANYQTVILNLVPLLDEELASTIDLDRVLARDDCARLLFSKGSEIIAIGVPDLKTSDGSCRYFTDWLPAFPRYVPKGGKQLQDVKPEFEYYFKCVSSWPFYVFPGSVAVQSGGYAAAVHPQTSQIKSEISPLAKTLFWKPIGFKLQFRAVESRKSRTESFVANSGWVIWLPPTTEISHYEAVNLILRERYGLCLEQAPPDWVEPYKLPNQLPIEDEIGRLNQEIHDLTTQLTEAQQRLKEASCFQRLLYEQGEDALEPVVRDALRELGAQVQDPEQPGREDGRLAAPTGQNGMLEIKGGTKSIRLRDVRQLYQWVGDAVAEENWDSKGLLIANTFCGDPISQRGEPFPDNCIRAAEKFEHCLLTTTQLFRALCSHQRGELDVEGFWSTVFNTDGVCPLPELEPLEEQGVEAGEADT